MTYETTIPWFDSTIRVRSDKDRLWVTFNQTVFAVDPVTSRAPAAALSFHADAIDPQEGNEEDAMTGQDEGEAQWLGDDRGEVIGYLAKSDGTMAVLYVVADHALGDALRLARARADRLRGTVTALHRGDIIHDATGPVQCDEYRIDGATQRCWRNEHAPRTWHVNLDEDTPGRPWLTDRARSWEDRASAIIAAVRDRDERGSR